MPKQSFAIIAIRTGKNPEDKSKNYFKALKEDTIYPFYDYYDYPNENDFEIIKEKGQELSGLYDIGNDTTVNISAIVGANGSGKSSLVELFLWAAYVIGYRLDLLDFENKALDLLDFGNKALDLLSVGDNSYIKKGNAINYLDFEILYRVDGQLYSIAFEGEEIKLSSYEKKEDSTFSKKSSKSLMKEIEDKKAETTLENFFYSIVTNYSLYAFNSEETKLPINYLFYKNDGYQTPLLINPMRKQGNIDINNEKKLLQQRLIANLLEDIGDHEEKDSLRNLANGQFAKEIELELNIKKEKNLTPLGKILKNIFSDKSDSDLEAKIKDLSSWLKKVRLFIDKERENQNEALKELHIGLEIGVLKLSKDVINDNEKIINKDIVTGIEIAIGTKIRREYRQELENLENLKDSTEEVEKIIKKYYNGKKNLMNSESIKLPIDFNRSIEIGIEIGIKIRRKLEEKNELDLERGIKLAKELVPIMSFSMSSYNLSVLGKVIYFEQLRILLEKELNTQLKISISAVEVKYQEYITTYLINKIDNIKKIHLPYKDFSIKDFIEEIKTSNSYIFFKIQSCILYWKYWELIFDDTKITTSDNDTITINIAALSQTIQDIKGKEKDILHLNTSMFVPPPIFDATIILEDEEGKKRSMNHLSSGEKQKIYGASSLVYSIININSVEKKESLIKYSYINIVLDEIELYYHPEWQRTYIADLLDYIKKIDAAHLADIKGINILFLTHSPYILSDIPRSNILRLDKGKPVHRRGGETFAANIHSLLANDFFMSKGFMGEWAKRRINEVIYYLNEEDRTKKIEIEEIINLVGEPVLKAQLQKMYNELFATSEKEKKIQRAKALLEREGYSIDDHKNKK